MTIIIVAIYLNTDICTGYFKIICDEGRFLLPLWGFMWY